MLAIAQALKEKQRERRETQAQFAEYLGITQASLSRIYSGERGIGGEIFPKVLAKYPEFVSFFAEN